MKRNKTRYMAMLITFLLTLTFATVGLAAKKVVAVMPIQTINSKLQPIARIMGEQLASALFRSGRATVIERNQLQHALKEAGFGMTGAVDQNTAVKTGKMLGAGYSLIGTLTRADTNSNPIPGLILGKFSGLANNVQAHIGANLRVINNETGELIRVVDVEGHETGKTVDDAVQNACKEAADKFLEEMLGSFVGVIVDVEGNRVYIDAGSAQGVRKGEKLEIAREGQPITLPNGKMIMKYKTLGLMKVVELHEDYAICEVYEGSITSAQGAVARRKK